MRVKPAKPKDPMTLPDELFVQPQLLDNLAQQQDRGGMYFGECVYPPWKRQRKSLKAEKKFRHGGKITSLTASHVKMQASKLPKTPFTPEEDKVIVAERRRGTTWELISRLLPGRTAAIVKKHYHQNLKPPRQTPGVPQQPSALTGGPQKQQAAEGGALVPLTREEQEKKLYNKIVIIPTKLDAKKRPQLFFVLHFNPLAQRCHLVPLMEDGTFRREGPRSGRTKWKLVPEGQGEELESVPAVDCTIVKSEAANKVSDADKEAWQVFDHRYA